ncbi:hypothetical protein [Halorientalis salina]|uniref:hypothetical protein n=1 Tax=Halorientalis salina TaxID=2932266 RepID=UPI0010ACFB9B|nr:hypothetical protein [Halorientalis salina]
MKRRQMLAATGAALFAGCTSDTDSPTDTAADDGTATTAPAATETATATASPTATATRTPQPSIRTLEPVTKRLAFDEEETISAHTTSAFGRGAEPFVALDATIPVHGNAAEFKYGGSVSRNGTEVEDFETDLITEAVSDSDQYVDNYWVNFGRHEWETGTYTAEIVVTDTLSSETTTATTEFDIVTPLADREVQLISTDLPTHATAGESLSYALTFENRADRASSLVTDLSLRQGPDTWMDLDQTLTLNMRPKETRRIENSFTPSSAGRFEIRLDHLDDTFGFTIDE